MALVERDFNSLMKNIEDGERKVHRAAQVADMGCMEYPPLEPSASLLKL